MTFFYCSAFTFSVTGLKNGILTEQWHLTGILYHRNFNQKLVDRFKTTSNLFYVRINVFLKEQLNNCLRDTQNLTCSTIILRQTCVWCQQNSLSTFFFPSLSLSYFWPYSFQYMSFIQYLFSNTVTYVLYFSPSVALLG